MAMCFHKESTLSHDFRRPGPTESDYEFPKAELVTEAS